MVAPIETDVLQRMIENSANGGGELPPEVARVVLSWRFADRDQERLSELLAKSRRGGLSDEEARRLDWYLLLGDFLTIIQSKARLSLSKAPSAA